MGVFIELRAEDGFLSRGYLALPPAGRGPGIIVQQEIFGLNRQIRGICDLLAEEGYTTPLWPVSDSARGTEASVGVILASSWLF
jgi:dienelactone hydrolase